MKKTRKVEAQYKKGTYTGALWGYFPWFLFRELKFSSSRWKKSSIFSAECGSYIEKLTNKTSCPIKYPKYLNAFKKSDRKELLSYKYVFSTRNKSTLVFSFGFRKLTLIMLLGSFIANRLHRNEFEAFTFFLPCPQIFKIFLSLFPFTLSHPYFTFI